MLHRCTRGAYGTRATAHTTKAEAYKLWDSPERYVTPDGALRDSVKKYLERRIEASGVSVVLQAGAPGQELLDGSLRVRQAEHWESSEGISKSGYLGWINIHAADQRRAATSLDDVEWLMSKAVGFDAGYGLLVDKKAIQEHGRLNEILEQIRQWDRLRCAGNLSEKQREALRDPYQDWHLEKEDDTHVKLFQWNYSRRYKCNFIEADSLLISAEPWEWKSDAPGNFGLRIQVDGKLSIINPMINTEKGLAMFPCTIKPGQSLVFDSGETAFVMDANFKKIAEVTMEGIALLPEGMSEVRFMCETMKEGDEPKVTLRYITSSLMASLGF